jgi:hypothetical protein
MTRETWLRNRKLAVQKRTSETWDNIKMCLTEWLLWVWCWLLGLGAGSNGWLWWGSRWLLDQSGAACMHHGVSYMRTIIYFIYYLIAYFVTYVFCCVLSLLAVYSINYLVVRLTGHFVISQFNNRLIQQIIGGLGTLHMAFHCIHFCVVQGCTTRGRHAALQVVLCLWWPHLYIIYFIHMIE